MMKMDIGVSIYSIPGNNLDVILKFTLDNDFKAIELWDSQLPEKPICGYEGLNELGIGISIHGPLLDIGDIESIQFNIKSIFGSIVRAQGWKADKLILHTGIYHGDWYRAYNTAKKVIEACIPKLEETGIRICIENVGYLGNDLIKNFEQMKAFVDIFPKQFVGVVFDVAHANIVGGVEKGISSLGHRIMHIHISDNTGGKKDHHWPVGEGNINFSSLANVLNQCNAILEINPICDWEKKLVESRKKLENLGIVG